MNPMWIQLLQAVSEQNCLTINNPVITGIKNGKIPPNHGVEALRQYFYLVATIVHLLSAAMTRIPNQAVKDELRRNIEEELGSRNNGVSHQELLETRLMEELGITVRVGYTKPTATFIAEMFLNFHIMSPCHVAGMIYALEATAKPELIMVAHLINATTQKNTIRIEKLTDDSEANGNTLEGFIAMHTKDFEVGHESGLRESLEGFVFQDIEDFHAGFYHVLSAMQIWWNEQAGFLTCK
jgi:hypothetical protein